MLSELNTTPITHGKPLVVDSGAQGFYRRAAEGLFNAGVPFLVGGAYAYQVYTGIIRETKDFDVFVKPDDLERTLAVLDNMGYRTEIFDPVWIAKAWHGDYFVDIIFASRNGLCEVDDDWFHYAQSGIVLGLELLLSPVEEMIWSKAFVLERERYDGADIVHLLHEYGDRLDWDRLLHRFGKHWPVLLSHLILFFYVYPTEHGCIPKVVMDELMSRVSADWTDDNPSGEKKCRGPFISGTQYKVDVNEWGYEDALVSH